MKSFVLGAEKTEQITVSVMSYERPASGEYYDDNWLSCEVAIRAGAFRGKYAANFLTSELLGLAQELERLYRDLSGEVTFNPMEGQLRLKFTCDNLGHIHVSAKAMDEAGIGHTLTFSVSFDQTYLAASLASLKGVTNAFPVRT